MLENILGSFFIGYYKTPQIVPKCNSRSCHSYQKILVTVSYLIPQWFLQRILLVAISYANRDGLGISIRTIRSGSNSDAIWTYIQNGDLAMVQTLFKNGEASPFDVVADNGTSILEVGSTLIFIIFTKCRTKWLIAIDNT